MADKVPMTPAGQLHLREEVQRLKDDRPRISRAIGEAREHGDLKENAEYHAAKEEQGIAEARIKDLESALSRAEVIDPKTLSGAKIRFGATVTLSNTTTEEEVTYQLLGPYESDIANGCISVTAPLARAMLSKEVGDEVTIQKPDGTKRVYEIIEVVYK